MSWRARLLAEITRQERTMRSVSLEAGLGAGYLHSVLKDDKDPTVERLIRICDVLEVSLPLILYGIDLSPESAEILQRLQASPEKRAALLLLLRG